MLDRPTHNLLTLRAADQRTEAMASTMFEGLANGHDVTEAFLAREGFSTFEIARLGTAARQLAEQRFVRHDEASPRPVRKTLDERMTLAADACLDEICDRLAAELTRAAETIDEVTWRKLVSKTAHRLATSPLPANLGAEVSARRSGVA